MSECDWRWLIAIDGSFRRFLFLFGGILFVSSSILISLSVVLHRSGGHHRIEMVQEEETHAVGMRQDAIAGIIAAAVSDLLFLSELNELDPFLGLQSEESRTALSRELVAFARRQEIYDQIRILSPTGMEMLRVEYRENSPFLVPVEDLQSKGDRYYFQAMTICAAGTVYVSPLDLNVEKGEVERPLRPMLRLGLALGDGDGIRGYVVLNLKGSLILDAFSQAHPNPEGMELLVAADGYWLRGPTRDSNWGFALSDRVDERIQNLFPEEWKTISESLSGQLETAEGLFTFDTLIPSDEADAVRCAVTGASPSTGPGGAQPTPLWKNVSWVPPHALAGTRNAGAAHLAGWNLVGVCILGTGAWGFSRWMTRRGDLHQRTAKEKELLQSTLRKYMPQEIRSRLLADPARHAQLGGEAQDVAVMFADIRGFTRFSERHEPEDVVAVLNRILTELTAPLRVYRGILDKYVGDGFLAFFEPSPDLSNAAQRAVDSARVMQRVFRNLWLLDTTDALRELGLGIGISTGRVIVGNVGSENAMDYTVVGDAVNVAARLQDLAEAGEILVSQSTHELTCDEGDAEIMRRTKLRGRRKPMNVYKLRSDAKSATE